MKIAKKEESTSPTSPEHHGVDSSMALLLKQNNKLISQVEKLIDYQNQQNHLIQALLSQMLLESDQEDDGETGGASQDHRQYNRMG